MEVQYGFGVVLERKIERGKDQFDEEREDWVESYLTHLMRSNPCQPSLNSVLRTSPATKLPWSKPSSLMAQFETCMSSPENKVINPTQILAQSEINKSSLFKILAQLAQ